MSMYLPYKGKNIKNPLYQNQQNKAAVKYSAVKYTPMNTWF